MALIWYETTAGRIAETMKARWIQGDPDVRFQGIATDSRQTCQGKLFWALKGEFFDAHDFLEQAVAKGASGLLVQSGRTLPPLTREEIVVLAVEDPIRALGNLAAWWRHQVPIKVVTVTGSAGKTTTKEMIATILNLGEKTLWNEGNLNNLIGLPLTLFRLETEHRCAVLEMGMNRKGEIAALTDIADPDVGVITNVGPAHTEGLGDLAGVAAAKVEMIERIRSTASVVVNGDNQPLMEAVAGFDRPVVTFGFSPGNTVRAERIDAHGHEGFAFDLVYGGRTYPMTISVPGLQNVWNALGAAAAALCLSIHPDQIAEGLRLFKGMHGRFEILFLGSNILLVDDTYNANPLALETTLASLEALAAGGRRIVIGLGDMLELGDAALHAHREAGRRVTETGAEWFLAAGRHASDMQAGAIEAGMPPDRIRVVANATAMLETIVPLLREGDLVFLKGSRRMGLDLVSRGLHETFGEGEQA
ncbi:UDP-N-acetylmuramoyl-tripeptide--D-alanyl-D-alanine ligase [uncultured Desulfatiglans sp.]|nr:UDP-N-acetylmuramoyl-tripeptide--D-alanyl-D-alanine ligase [uncultured Desulfatiglans sp.]